MSVARPDLHKPRTSIRINNYRSCVKNNFFSPEDGHIVPETCRELKNRINKYIKGGASSWFSARNIARCTGNKTLKKEDILFERNKPDTL
jgi:hypothetical protein